MVETITFIHSLSQNGHEQVSLYSRNETERRAVAGQLFRLVLEGLSRQPHDDYDQRIKAAAQIYALIDLEKPLFPARHLAEIPFDEKTLDLRVVDVDTGLVLYGDPNDIPIYDIEYFDEHDDGSKTVGKVDLSKLDQNPPIEMVRGIFDANGNFMPFETSSSGA